MARSKSKVWKDEEAHTKYPKKWSSRKEYNTVKRVLSRIRDMQEARRTSCPWSFPGSPSYEIEGGRAGNDWATAWNIDDKNFYMIRDYVEGRSNLVSSIVFATTMAFLTEFEENRIGQLFTPVEKEDRAKARIYKAINDDWENRNGIQSVRAASMLETAIKGTAITYNGWQIRKRTVKTILSSKETEKMLEDEETSGYAKETIDKGKPLVRDDEVVTSKAVEIRVDLHEWYVDPDARVLRGDAYEAADCAWVQLLSQEQFNAEFLDCDDPYVNHSNVKATGPFSNAWEAYTEGAAPFIEPPSDITDSKIILYRYYNKPKDEYIVIANDLCIRKGPMPWNFKELPFTVHTFFPINNHIYGFGIPRVLEGDKAEIETLSNMRIDQRHLEINPPLFVNTDVFADVDQGWEIIRPGQKVEVGGEVGPSNIRWLEKSAPDFDTPRALEDIKQNAIQATGINPLTYAVPMRGEAVRTNILAMESTLKQIKRGIKQWAKAEVENTKQRIRLWNQYLPEEVYRELDPENGKLKSKKVMTIRTDGVSMKYESGEIVEEKIDGYDYFDIKEEYLDLDGEIDVQIDMDSLVPRSYGLKVSQIQDAMKSLPPILANKAMMEAPGVVPLIVDYVELMGLGDRITDQLQDDGGELEMLAAEAQNEAMLAGEVIPGIPGESTDHIMQHYAVMNEKLGEKSKAIKRLEEMQRSFVDPFTGMPLPLPSEVTNGLEKLDNVIELFREHISQDATPKPEAVPAIVQASMPQTQQAPQMAPQGGQMPPEMSGGMGMPMTQAPMNPMGQMGI